MPYSETELAARIKAKYPQYAGMSDGDLVAKVVAKHPQYASQLSSSSSSGAQEEPSGGFGNPAFNLGAGVAKGIGSTVYGLGKLASNIPGVSRLSQALGADPEYANFETEKPDALTPQGTAQNIGFAGEQLAEFFLPGSAVSKIGKVGSLATKGQKVIGAVKNIGAQALSDAGVSAAQGGDPLASGIMSAGVGGTLGAVGAGYRAGKAAAGMKLAGQPDEITMIADRLGQTLTVGQRSGSTVTQRMEALLRKWTSTQDIFHKSDKAANVVSQKIADTIADTISKNKMTEVQAGEFIQNAVEGAADAAGVAYAAKVDPIIAAAGQIDVPLTGKIKDTATKLLARFNTGSITAPRQIETVGSAVNLLEQLANPTMRFEGANALEQAVAAGFNPTPQALQAFYKSGGQFLEVPRTLNFAEAKNLRTMLFKLSHSGKMDLGKGAVRELNSAIDSTMKQALVDSGLGNLADDFEAASSAYRGTQDLLEHSVIKSLAKNDRPGDIVNYIVKNAPETGTAKLRELIGPVKMHDVERAMWERVITDATQDGVLVGQSLRRNIEKMGPEATQAIFPDAQRLKDVEDFAKMVDNLGHTKALASDPSRRLGSGMVIGASAFATGAVYGVMSGDFKKMTMSVGGLATIILGPRHLAKIMASPGGAKLAQQALTTPPASQTGRFLAARLMQIAGVKATGKRDEEQE